MSENVSESIPPFAQIHFLLTGDSVRVQYDPGDTVADLLEAVSQRWQLKSTRGWLPVLIGKAGGTSWGIQLHKADKLPTRNLTLNEYCRRELEVDRPGATAYTDEDLSAEEAEKRGWRKGGLGLYAASKELIGFAYDFRSDWPNGDLVILLVSNIAGG
jgi:hypothetical protein